MRGLGKATGTSLKSLARSLPGSVIPPVSVRVSGPLFVFRSVCPSLSSFLRISLSLHVCLISLHISLFLCVSLSASLCLSPSPIPLLCLPLAL